jgi:PAS domain-containing protein
MPSSRRVRLGPEGLGAEFVADQEDLSGQQAIENARHDAAEMFETAFARAPVGVALIGLDGLFIPVNAALCEILGRPEDQIVGSTSQPFTHPDDLVVTADAYVSLRTAGTPVKRYVRLPGLKRPAARHV